MATVLDAQRDRPQAKCDSLIKRTKGVRVVPTAVVHPRDETSLSGVVGAAEVGMIIPILVGPERKVRAVADEHCLDISKFELVDVPHSHAAAAKAVELVRQGTAELLTWPGEPIAI